MNRLQIFFVLLICVVMFAILPQPTPVLAVECEGSLPHRLEIGHQGRISQRFDTVRSQPAGSPIKVVYAPAYFVVLEGPICAGYGTLTWYKVQFDDGLIGWVPESEIFSLIYGWNNYWLEPAPDMDSDGDGLQDRWETNGVTIDPDLAGPMGVQFIDLPAMGADPNIPDIFIQVDWMADTGHSHRLQQNAIQLVVGSFANRGYQMHVDQGADSILDFSTMTTWGTLSRARQIPHVDPIGSFSGPDYDWTAFQAIKDETGGFTESGRTPVFHYTISAHDYSPTGSSGISRGISASDFIVSLGSWDGNTGTLEQQAGTFMHELGHNLGLWHGGNENVNRKPNYLSIMSYTFQVFGIIQGGAWGTFDYSGMDMDDLNELALNETLGLGTAGAGFGTNFSCGFVADASLAIDWDCNGTPNGVSVSADINSDGTQSTLTGFDDWANIQLIGGGIGQAGVTITLPLLTPNDEFLTPALAEEILNPDSGPLIN